MLLGKSLINHRAFIITSSYGHKIYWFTNEKTFSYKYKTIGVLALDLAKHTIEFLSGSEFLFVL